MQSEVSREGRGRRWGREVLIIAPGVFLFVMSALFPSYEGWVVRGIAVVGVAIALAIGPRLEDKVRPSSPSAPPVPGDGRSYVRHQFVGVGPLEMAEKAMCEVLVDGEGRTGMGALVAAGTVVTAAQAVRGSGRVKVRFRDGAGGSVVEAERVELGDDGGQIEVAVLHLEEDVAVPKPVGLWPARRLLGEVMVLGDRSVEGPTARWAWGTARLAGTAQGSGLLLDWDTPGGSVEHNGAPVCDRDTGLMVGVLVAGPEPGRLDRMVAVSEIRRVWAELPRPWLLAGEGARAHFTQRAKGQRSVTRGGDLFRGRIAALEVVDDWMRAEKCPGAPLVVTAQPGAGKSAVVARALLIAERAGHSDGVGFHARAAVIGDFVEALAAACGIDSPGSWKELAQDLATHKFPGRLVVVVDALDEAAGNDMAELRLVLRDLARLDWARVVVATRPLARGDAYRRGGHLHALGVARGAASGNLLDLDTDRFHEPGDLRAYAADQLTQAGFTTPGPPGAAWETYRRDPDLRDRLAELVAERAGRNYLVAGMSAFQLAEDETAIDPASPGFDPSEVPRGVGEALSKHLERLPQVQRRRALDLLTALAYGRGPGLDDQRWLTFTRTLGGESVTRDDLDQLCDSAAADYLLETTLEESGEHVTRLFHQALADELVARRTRPSDERRLLALLRSESQTESWLDVSSYARRFVPNHAAVAGTLERLLDKADFLAGMLPDGMRSVLPGVKTNTRADPAAIYNLALPFLGNSDDDQGLNAAILEFISSTQGNATLANDLATLDVERPWHATGKIRPLDTALARFDGHTSTVVGVACLEWPGVDHPVVVTTSGDGTARVWDPQRPDSELARFDGWACRGLADRSVVLTMPLGGGRFGGCSRSWRG